MSVHSSQFTIHYVTSHHLIALFLLLAVGCCYGQTDSLAVSVSQRGLKAFLSQHNDDAHYAEKHSFRWSGTVVPAALITTGTLISYVPQWHEQIDIRLRDAVQSDGHASFKIEDYGQYAPLAMIPTLKLCGMKSQHGWRDLINLTGGSYLIGSIVLNVTKYSTWKERPNGSNWQTSFPSGHTFTAFTSAEILRREYGKEYPIVPIVGYTVATGVGVMRIYNNKHWASDVLAGAGLGILSASVMYWLAPYLRF